MPRERASNSITSHFFGTFGKDKREECEREGKTGPESKKRHSESERRKRENNERARRASRSPSLSLSLGCPIIMRSSGSRKSGGGERAAFQPNGSTGIRPNNYRADISSAPERTVPVPGASGSAERPARAILLASGARGRLSRGRAADLEDPAAIMSRTTSREYEGGWRPGKAAAENGPVQLKNEKLETPGKSHETPRMGRLGPVSSRSLSPLL